MGIAAERLNKKIEYSILLSFYGGLLTENQRSLVSMYCDEDLSLGEIAEQLSVSRQGVSDSLNRAFERLNRFEEFLGVVERIHTVNDQLRQCIALINRRQEQQEQDDQILSEIKSLIQNILLTNEEK